MISANVSVYIEVLRLLCKGACSTVVSADTILMVRLSAGRVNIVDDRKRQVLETFLCGAFIFNDLAALLGGGVSEADRAVLAAAVKEKWAALRAALKEAGLPLNYRLSSKIKSLLEKQQVEAAVEALESFQTQLVSSLVDSHLKVSRIIDKHG